MNLEQILRHDICDHLMDHFTLEIIATLNMISKKVPDLIKHPKIKNVFYNDFSHDPYFLANFAEMIN